MLSTTSRAILSVIGTFIMGVFVLGLAHSISTGFAGFWGGLPFWIISLGVLSLAVYDCWDECLRKR